MKQLGVELHLPLDQDDDSDPVLEIKRRQRKYVFQIRYCKLKNFDFQSCKVNGKEIELEGLDILALGGWIEVRMPEHVWEGLAENKSDV